MTARQCPVCRNVAEHAGDRDYGDKERIVCPRCGSFEVSGSAMAMMEGRLGEDALARARLSHAVRMQPRKPGEWFMILSTNLDELISRPLPDIDNQTANLLLWLSAQLADDRLGYVHLPNPEELAGAVGTVDGERVRRLLKQAESDQLIEMVAETRAALTKKGWQQVTEKRDQTAPTSAPKAVQMPHNESQVVKANCNLCGGDRNAFLRRTYTQRGDDDVVAWSDTIETLECCGCGGLSIRHTHWFSEWDDFGYDRLTGKEILIPGIRETVWPARSARPRPEWIDNIDDEVIRTVAGEVYGALDQGLNALAAVGTRTLLDRALHLRVGDPPNGFLGKLKAMVEAGHVGKGEMDVFLAITDAGSAAAHRGYVPDKEVLDSVMSATEAFLHREFILPKQAAAVRKATPKREKG